MRRVPPSLWTMLLSIGLAVTSASAMVAVYMPPEDLARRATLVIEGRVARTASGLDPETGTLATYVTLAVERVLRGPAELAELTVREPGGRNGDLYLSVDAAPAYEPGERVLVFLEPASDGALRTSGMFFGKFSLERDDAVRDLGGAATFGRPAPGRHETLSRADLIAVVATIAPAADRPFRAVPPETGRLLWDDVREPGAEPGIDRPGAAGPAGELALDSAAEAGGTRFVHLFPDDPVRWNQVDAGGALPVNIERARDPLGDPDAAIDAVIAAMQAWNAVPESRVALVPGDTDYDFTGRQSRSPNLRYTRSNIVLFGDPYDDLPDPSGCSGVLALGGLWWTTSDGSQVNGESYNRALELYVIFNDNFECFLGDPDNLAEIAAHELGHGLGLGHSPSEDSIMRAWPYGARGPRLGDDDRDAAHCHYPHRLTLQAPNGGERWTAGTVQAALWSTTEEAGGDRGTVDLELSVDGGASWTMLAAGEPNDGYAAWVVPERVGEDARVRVVRRTRYGLEDGATGRVCSQDASNASFSIVAPPVGRPGRPRPGRDPLRARPGRPGRSPDRAPR